MKKQILIAVGASALIATSAFADVSITGDSLFRVSNNSTGAGTAAVTSNKNEQRVRLHFVGKAGKTSVHMTMRSEGQSRAGRIQQGGSQTSPDNNSLVSLDKLYIKTSIGKVNVKAGDWWWTTGFGLVQKGKGTGDRIELSTKVNGWKLIGGYNTNNKADGTELNVSLKPTNTNKKKVGTFYFVAKGEVKGWKVGFKHTVDTILSEKATANLIGENGLMAPDNYKGVEVHDSSFFDITVKGSVKGIHIASEYFKSSIGDSRADAFLLNVSKKVKGINLHFATAYYGSLNGRIYNANNSHGKFAPLGVSFLGTANGTNGGLALTNVSQNYNENVATSFVGFRADFKAKGMDIKAALGSFDANQSDKRYVANNKPVGGTDTCKTTRFCDGANTFLDLSVSYPLSKGATLKGTYGSWAGQSSMGAKISMKF